MCLTSKIVFCDRLWTAMYQLVKATFSFFYAPIELNVKPKLLYLY